MTMPTLGERQELELQFADDVARMQRCLRSAGREIADDDVVRAWAAYSDSVCVGWLPPPDEDGAMLAILLKHMPLTRAVWQVTLLDAGDGSGDAILPLPDDLVARLGWHVGDELELLQEGPGEIIIRPVKASA